MAPHSPSSRGRPTVVGTMCRTSPTITGRVHRPEMPLWTSSTTFFTTGCQFDDPVRLWKQRNRLGERRHRREIIQHCRQKIQQPCQYHHHLLNGIFVNVNKGDLLTQYFDVSRYQGVFRWQFFPSQKLWC